MNIITHAPSTEYNYALRVEPATCCPLRVVALRLLWMGRSHDKFEPALSLTSCSVDRLHVASKSDVPGVNEPQKARSVAIARTASWNPFAKLGHSNPASYFCIEG